jgi:hypothetical protein
MDRASRDSQRVSLAVAAAVVYFRFTGKQVEGRRDAQTLGSLDAVARALANVVSIHVMDGSQDGAELTPADLLGGDFHRGARLFRASDGREFSNLTVARGDMVAAIAILRAAGARFR